ncbi:Imm1 family immunity protein [Actinokineospora sp. PR83]|uniref:Imm1 family immunity protein n=1 Tax=Actinokineospora sp. PR83 TaxID=2884908 RepID=UPI001EEB5559|nr:Imm1 family immunity protein [Actinokineospora sp. PR83]MCG8918767.1 Imm1 family immunity protein [Actinokineospora sp. PR83]
MENKHGDRYPVAALPCCDDLPPRVRRGTGNVAIVGHVEIDGRGFGTLTAHRSDGWAVEMDRCVPTTGTKSTWSDYFLAGLDETSIPPHAEVPVETVYAAVAEFLVTGQRPTCVEW